MTPPAARFDAGAVRKAGQAILEDRITSRQKPSHELLRPGDVGRAVDKSGCSHRPRPCGPSDHRVPKYNAEQDTPIPGYDGDGQPPGATKSSAALSLVHYYQWVPTALRLNTSIGLMAMA